MAASQRDPVFVIEPPAPLPNTPSHVHEFYDAIGQLLLTWSRLEVHVEVLERMAINIEARTKRARPMVVPLARKIETIRLIYRDCPELKNKSRTVKRLMDRIGVLGNDRHIIVHSIFRGFTDGPPPLIVVRHVTHWKGNIRVARGQFTVKQLHTLSRAIAKAHDRLMPVLKDAVERQDPERLRKARSQGRSAGEKILPIRL